MDNAVFLAICKCIDHMQLYAVFLQSENILIVCNCFDSLQLFLQSAPVFKVCNKTANCNMSLTYWKTPKQVNIERLDNLPFIYFGPNFLVIKKMAYFLEISGKWLIIQGKKNLIIMKAPAEELMPHLQISFKSWLYIVDTELYISLSKSMLWLLEKVSF